MRLMSFVAILEWTPKNGNGKIATKDISLIQIP